jgi:para-aminobenzoate synthetase component I
VSLFTYALPYYTDTRAVFDTIADEPWAIWLDSGIQDGQPLGRYDILSAQPTTTLLTHAGCTRITRIARPEGVSEHSAPPLSLLREQLARREKCSLPDGIPFAGGAMGYWGYDLAGQIDQQPVAALSPASADHREMPEMAIGLYDWALIVDHRLRRSTWVTTAAWDDPQGVARYWADRLCHHTPTPRAAFRVTGAVSTLFDAEAYRAAALQVKAYITAGDCYQVNLAQRFSAPAEGDAWLAYGALRQHNPAPYGAFMRYPGGAVLSSSPEQFLSVQAGRVTTRPIKGTRRRDPDPQVDEALLAELIGSDKDRAENLMIVDLLRNDLGRVCVPGSIQVPALFRPETFARVHHLMSTVTGQLRADVDVLTLLEAAFPGGSITGAPKRRAMEIIAALEGHRRGVYCGSIGWINDAGDMDSNIAIRTAVCAQGQIHAWAGGGIVADSDWQMEYQECLTKAAPFFDLLRTHTLSES